MKKIPTLFKRTYDGPRIKGITDEVTPGLEWVLAGEGLGTVKIDGTCCAVINGKFYKRYDAKKGKTPPPGAIPCRARAGRRAVGRPARGLRLSPRYALRLPSRTCRACDATGREAAQADLCAGRVSVVKRRFCARFRQLQIF